MSILIDILLDTIQNEFQKKEPIWRISSMKEEDILFLEKECVQDSEFDPTQKRRTMFENLVKGHAPVVVATCEYGQVTAVVENNRQIEEIPWGLWARIFRIFHEKNKERFKVYFLANSTLRKFPPGKKPITPENINGGYTYPCNRETILIYRAEDATRVLLHELMHSCCLDKHETGVDHVEAETEAWAELAYFAFLSRGDPYTFQELLEQQSAWMLNQNEEVKKHMHNQNSKEFPWRYTLGKEKVWKRWNILSNKYKKSNEQNKIARTSLRLTFPVDNAIKKRFHVKESSTIL